MTVSKRRAASAIIIAVLLKKKRNKEQMKRLWVRRWIRARETDDAALKLIQEIRNDDEKAFIDMFRLSGQQFDYLLERIRPLITKKNTNMRKSISAELRLLITLKFLSSGDSYRSLMYFFRVRHNTISGIIPNTCKAIFSSLRTEFMKVFANRTV